MITGKLQNIVEIHKPYQKKNEFGEVEDYFEKSFQTKAEIIYLNGSRTVENEEIQNQYRVKFNVWWYHKITEKDRVKYDGKFYLIEAIELQKPYRLQSLYCSKINE